MPGTVRIATITLLSAALLVASACSSVPDVHYVDGGESSSGSSDGDADSSGSDASSGAPNYDCQANKPPTSVGVCCGNKLCIKCIAADCSECNSQGCGGTMSDVCCRKNRSQLFCRPYSDC